jgi:hypothetical protein
MVMLLGKDLPLYVKVAEPLLTFCSMGLIAPSGAPYTWMLNGLLLLGVIVPPLELYAVRAMVKFEEVDAEVRVVAVGEKMMVSAIGVGLGVAVGVGVGASVGVRDGVGDVVAVGIGDAVTIAVAVAVAVGVGGLVGARRLQPASIKREKDSAQKTKTV